MSLKLYMDVHVHLAITEGLRRRGVDVLTAQEDGARRFDDDVLLNRAGELGRILFSQDEDFLTETARRQQIGELFAGVILGDRARSRLLNTSLIWNCLPRLASRTRC